MNATIVDATGAAAVVFVAIVAAVGGTLGARIGRRVPAPVLRGLVVVIGLFVAIRLLVD